MIDPAEAERIKRDLVIFFDHQEVASFTADHRAYVEGDDELVIYCVDGVPERVEVRRFNKSEWHGSSAPGDDVYCGGPPGLGRVGDCACSRSLAPTVAQAS